MSAAKLVGEVAGIERFRSRNALARHNATAPTPVGSGNPTRHRLSRAVNRQPNAAAHRIALTQARSNPQARTNLQRRQQAGATHQDTLRCPNRRLSEGIYRAMLSDAATLSLAAPTPRLVKGKSGRHPAIRCMTRSTILGADLCVYLGGVGHAPSGRSAWPTVRAVEPGGRSPPGWRLESSRVQPRSLCGLDDCGRGRHRIERIARDRRG